MFENVQNELFNEKAWTSYNFTKKPWSNKRLNIQIELLLKQLKKDIFSRFHKVILWKNFIKISRFESIQNELFRNSSNEIFSKFRQKLKITRSRYYLNGSFFTHIIDGLRLRTDNQDLIIIRRVILFFR
jgi:hypothetical protein